MSDQTENVVGEIKRACLTVDISIGHHEPHETLPFQDSEEFHEIGVVIGEDGAYLSITEARLFIDFLQTAIEITTRKAEGIA